MSTVQPLPVLLSQALVAFTIEFDNEFEHQMPHRTTNHGGGSRSGPWLVSMVMWFNCMRFVGAEGIRLSELVEHARTPTNLNGMQRWGYVIVEKEPAGPIIRATPKGRKAQEIWGPLFDLIEQRWQERFGKEEIAQLRQFLEALIRKIDTDLPDCLPILGYGLFSKLPDLKRQPQTPANASLVTLLSRVLLMFAIEFERESDLSLAIGANVLRVLDEKGKRVRDLPMLSGVSKEAISMAMGFLQKKHLAIVGPDPAGSRSKVARLTPQGREAQDSYRKLLAVLEERWDKRFGEDTIRNLRKSLAQLASAPIPEPYPDGWRASVPKPSTLPHFPMVLHRGGFPDGS